MAGIFTKFAGLTRKVPWLVSGVRAVLPRYLKRKIGAALLPSEKGGEVVANDGRKFVMIPDRLFLQVVYDGIFEPSLTNFMTTVIKPEDTTVDVGSNFGWFATLMAVKSSKNICYEPAKRIAGILKENIALNAMDNITVREVAIGSEPGEVTFVIEGDPERESALGYVATEGDDVANNTTETVKVVTLDEDLAQHKGEISLMKVDCEGFEHEAFKGAKNLLTCDNPPVFITEANREALGRSGTNREDMCALLKQYGYTLYGMRSNGTLYADDGKAPALVGAPPKGKFANRLTLP
ncbi:MAG: FkbM family methyltransferase [Mariniblastus sp.]